jgi:hypothetical protein
MPATSSYCKNGFASINDICFASFFLIPESLNYDTSYIIIEKEKQNYGIDFINEYLTKLQECNFPISKWEIVDEKIHVYLKKESHSKLTMAAIAIRFLWEGQYNRENAKSDYFIQIPRHFLNLCKYFPEIDVFRLLCIAHVLGLYKRNYINFDHTFGSNSIRLDMTSKKFKDLEMKNITIVMSNNDSLKLEPLETRDLYETKEDYLKALTQLNIL